MNNLRNTFDSGLQELKTLRDEIRLRLHLAGQEARDRWEKHLEPYVEKLEGQVKSATESTMETVRDALTRARAAFQEYRDQLLGSDKSAERPTLHAVQNDDDAPAANTSTPHQTMQGTQTMQPSQGSQSSQSSQGAQTSDRGDQGVQSQGFRTHDETTSFSGGSSYPQSTPSRGNRSQGMTAGQDMRQQQGMQAVSTRDTQSRGMQSDTNDDPQFSTQTDDRDDYDDDQDTLTSGALPGERTVTGIDEADAGADGFRGKSNGSPVATPRDRSAQRDANRMGGNGPKR